MPKVSVVIPAYNHEAYVQSAIQSVLAQTYKDFELIVINDGSTDMTHEIVSKLSEKYNFTYISQQNKGLSKTLKDAISLCKGDFIAILASDDVWIENKLELQVAHMTECPDVVACCAGVDSIDENDCIINKGVDRQSVELYSFDRVMLAGFNIPPATILIRKNAVESDFFDESLKVEDFFLWLKLTKKGGVISVLPETLAQYRLHSSNTTGNLALIAKYHHITIDRFQDMEVYQRAKTIWSLFSFRQLSRHYKLEAIKYIMLSPGFIFSRYFLIGFIKLMFYWGRT